MIDKSAKKTNSAPEKAKQENTITSQDSRTKDSRSHGFDLTDIPHQSTSSHSHHHSNDDDGKSHHFHFKHFTHRRRTMILTFLGKLILMATFISSLLAGFLNPAYFL